MLLAFMFSLAEETRSYHVQGSKRLIRPAIVRQDDIEPLENGRADSNTFVRGECASETATRPGIPGVVFYTS